jgi:peroxiredoxin
VELDVEDHWWHGDRYLNVPLADFYGAVLSTAKAGATVAIGGDVSEPGYDGYNKVALVPTFDIPPALIDQDAREYRIDNGSTTDDHGIHLVGWTQLDGADWFLIKDSARAGRKAEPQGYLFYRADYVKLKMLSFTVHKDYAKALLAKELPEGPPAMTLPATSPALDGVALKTLDGQAVTLEALAGGRPTLLVFWATWCPDCRKQTPALKSAFERFGPKGLNVVAVSTGGRDKVEMVKEYVAKNGLTYTVVTDADKAASKAYDIQWIPTFFLLDREGKVVYKSAELGDAATESLLAGTPLP